VSGVEKKGKLKEKFWEVLQTMKYTQGKGALGETQKTLGLDTGGQIKEGITN